MAAEGQGRYRRWRTPASLMLSLAVVGLAGYGLHHALRHVDPRSVMLALGDLRWSQVLRAVLFTGGSFLAIAGQEYFALRTAGRPLSFPCAGFGGFLAQSIGHSTGFSVAVGGALRYRLYSLFGVRFSDVAKVQASFSGTVALALCLQFSAAMLLHPALADHVVTLPPYLMRGVGALLALAVLGVLAATLRKKPVDVFGRHFEPPPFWCLLPQVLCSVADIACLAAAAYSLLPPELGADYPTVLGIAVVSLTLGIASAVPGGLGVFESSVLFLMAPARDLAAATVGALLAFRAFYYLGPLLIGAVGFAGLEVWRRWYRRRHPVG
ncbi:MAG TPA: hypothetical protein VMW18_01555 [Candidatus Binatia bacterium]|nr:hypothetical protein [Candidatus Binatia bacterium]